MNYLDELYLAYGSNVSPTEMGIRCPDGQFVGVGELKDTNLKFKGISKGYLTTFHDIGVNTQVAAYKITEEDKMNLDYYEGYPNLYNIKHTEIEIDGEIHKAFYYEMNEFVSIKAKDGKLYEYETMHEYPDYSYVIRCRNGYNIVGIDVYQLAHALEDLARCVWE